MSYWDTSPILKLYAAEPDSQKFLDHVVRSRSVLLTSDLTRVELLSALMRKERAGDLGPGGATLLYGRFLADAAAGRIAMLPVGTDVLAEAAALVQAAYTAPAPVMIRTLDVLHVATAVVARTGTLVATDVRMRAVATLAGLALFP